jgi:hypothetical protein
VGIELVLGLIATLYLGLTFFMSGLSKLIAPAEFISVSGRRFRLPLRWRWLQLAVAPAELVVGVSCLSLRWPNVSSLMVLTLLLGFSVLWLLRGGRGESPCGCGSRREKSSRSTQLAQISVQAALAVTAYIGCSNWSASPAVGAVAIAAMLAFSIFALVRNAPNMVRSWRTACAISKALGPLVGEVAQTTGVGPQVVR